MRLPELLLIGECRLFTDELLVFEILFQAQQYLFGINGFYQVVGSKMGFELSACVGQTAQFIQMRILIKIRDERTSFDGKGTGTQMLQLHEALVDE